MQRSNRDKIFDKVFIAALALLFVTIFIIGWLLLHQAVLFFPLAMTAGLLMLAQTIYYLEIKRELGQPHENYRQVEALFSMFSTLKLRHPLPPMRIWAISPDFANIVISLIGEHRPGLVLEMGSGVSTLVAAYIACRRSKKGWWYHLSMMSASQRYLPLTLRSTGYKILQQSPMRH